MKYCECGKRSVTFRKVNKGPHRGKLKVKHDPKHGQCYKCYTATRDSTRMERKGYKR